MDAHHVLDVVLLVALTLSGMASLAFLFLYWRAYRKAWDRLGAAWVYVVTLNGAVAWVVASTLGLWFWPGSLTLAVLRAAGLVVFTAAVSYQIYLLQRP